MNAEESTILDVLGIRIQNDIHWTEHMFEASKDAAKGLGFLERFKNAFPQPTSVPLKPPILGQN